MKPSFGDLVAVLIWCGALVGGAYYIASGWGMGFGGPWSWFSW
jgi:hypothetical protein